MEHDWLVFIQSHICELLIGFFITIFLGLFVDKEIIKVGNEYNEKKDKYKINNISEFPIFEIPSSTGSATIGKWERILFYISWIIKPEIIIAWFAFKVASKWELWNNVYKIPDVFNGCCPEKSLSARIWLGARTYQRFLLGAILNVLVALAGYISFIFLTKININFWGYIFLIFFSILYFRFKNIFSKKNENLN